jgi:hypothetical protein
MKAAHSLVEYFTKSTQAMDKLLWQQSVNPIYEGRNHLNVLQDVVTRWWSTYSRMLAHLRYLSMAIQVLTVNGKISVSDLSDKQKNILDEVEAGTPQADSQSQGLLVGGRQILNDFTCCLFPPSNPAAV